MAQQSFLATILGIPHIPSITQVNVRSGPGTNQDLIFKTDLGVKAFVQDVLVDVEENNRDGKVYQWFQLLFPDETIGWVRDDLIEVEGDGTQFGYGFVSQRSLAFELLRQPVAAGVLATDSTPTPDTEVTPVPTIETEVTPTPTFETEVMPSPTTESEVVPESEPAATTAAHATTMSLNGVNLRGGPSTTYNVVSRMAFKSRGEILDVQPEEGGGSRFCWVKINFDGTQGWIREDFLRLDGGYEAFGLAHADAYPAPLANSWWIRDWNLDPNFTVVHYGWDFAANVGEPVLAGSQGGTVTSQLVCTRCTPAQPSTLDQGFSLGDSRIFNDPAWGYGYGNAVIVRYLNEQLPQSTRDELTRRNFPGAHLFAIYAHLNSIDVRVGQDVMANQQIGTVGNTGNSTGAHLHLEIRAWNNPDETSFGRMLSNRLDPVVLFRR